MAGLNPLRRLRLLQRILLVLGIYAFLSLYLVYRAFSSGEGAFTGIIALVACVIFGGLLWFVFHSMAKPIYELRDSLSLLANGNAKITLEEGGDDELSQAANSLGTLAERMKMTTTEQRDVIEDLRRFSTGLTNAAHTVFTQASQISQASAYLSEGAMESAASVEEISASANEIGARTRSNADRAQEAAAFAAKSTDAAKQGSTELKQMTDAMNEVQKAGEQTTKVMKFIDDIAFQTNLLALNAAVEAARAGQHGKGFAVVAEEVRNLAGRSAKAAGETGELIEGMMTKVKNATALAMRTNTALQETFAASARVDALMNEIARASNEQAEAIRQLGAGIQQIEDVTQRNTANSEETSATAKDLEAQARDLEELVNGNATVFIHWDDSYSVGVDFINKQHKRLIDIINNLHSAMCRGQDRQALVTILKELVDYTVSHFHDEEELLRKHTYPGTHEQEDFHKTLIATVQDIKRKFESGVEIDSVEVMTFLKSWLLIHIKKTDMKYKPFLNARGVY